MNAALMLVFNRTPEQLDLTKAAIHSVLAQDIPTELHVVDNGSTEETWNYLSTLPIQRYRNIANTSPAKVANKFLAALFADNRHILCLANDTILPPNLYREFLKWPRGIVTASETRDRTYALTTPVDVVAVSENTPMSVLLLRKWAHDALMDKDGYFFDEQFEHYCSDCDWALRTASCGIRGIQLNLPYYHYGSASVRLADPFTLMRLRAGGDEDRARFERKYGFSVTSLQYGAMAQDINFRGER